LTPLGALPAVAATTLLLVVVFLGFIGYKRLISLLEKERLALARVFEQAVQNNLDQGRHHTAVVAQLQTIQDTLESVLEVFGPILQSKPGTITLPGESPEQRAVKQVSGETLDRIRDAMRAKGHDEASIARDMAKIEREINASMLP
jgi:Tfp pilus assembly protein PilO